MRFKVVALDLDGTLLGSDLHIRQDAAEAIAQVRAQGVRVVMVTGRHHVAALPYHHQLGLDTPLMCCNGTYAWDHSARRALLPRPLLKEQARQALRLIRQHGVHTLTYVDDAMTYETTEPHLTRLLAWANSVAPAVRPVIRQVESFDAQIDAAAYVWKFAITDPDLDRLHTFTAAIEQELGLTCEWSAPDRVDVAQWGNSKGRLLGDWLASEEIAPETVIAFGDSPNDISMLRLAGMGVAMGNSGDKVRAVAQMVAGSNDSDAIARTLRQHVLEPAQPH